MLSFPGERFTGRFEVQIDRREPLGGMGMRFLNNTDGAALVVAICAGFSAIHKNLLDGHFSIKVNQWHCIIE